MRTEDDQEIVRCVFHYDCEQLGQRGLAHVRSYREKYDDREGEEICVTIRGNVTFSTNDEGNLVPYTRDKPVTTSSHAL